MIRLTVIAAALLLAAAGPAIACREPIGDQTGQYISDKTGFLYSWRFVPAQPKVGEFFAIEFTMCPRGAPTSAEVFRIDAIMPAHKHGMNFQPKIAMISPGIYRAEGLMFHMPGTWQLIFEQRTPSGPMRVTATVEIE